VGTDAAVLEEVDVAAVAGEVVVVSFPEVELAAVVALLDVPFNAAAVVVVGTSVVVVLSNGTTRSILL
jgi:hypothetical protein